MFKNGLQDAIAAFYYLNLLTGGRLNEYLVSIDEQADDIEENAIGK